MSIHIPPYHCHQSIVLPTFNTVPDSPHVYPYTTVSLPLVHSYTNFQHSAEFTTCLSIYRRITATSPQFYQLSRQCRIHHMSIHIPPYHCHQSIVLSTFNTVPNSPHVYPYTAVSLPLVHIFINIQHCAEFTTCLSIYHCITATSPQFYQLSTQCRIHHMSIHIPLYHCHQSIVLPTFNTVPNSPHVYPYTTVITATSPQFYQHSTLCRIHHMSIHIPLYHCHQSIVLSTFNTVPNSPHVYPYTTVSLPLVHSFINIQHCAEFTTCLSIYRCITATSPYFYQHSTLCRIHHMSIHILPYHCHQSIVISTFNTVPNSPHVYPYSAISLPLVHSYINFQHGAKYATQYLYPYTAVSLPLIHMLFDHLNSKG